MTVGKAKRRKKQAWRRTQGHIRAASFPCPHCGSVEPHFVPPSLGDLGFYACSLAKTGTEDDG